MKSLIFASIMSIAVMAIGLSSCTNNSDEATTMPETSSDATPATEDATISESVSDAGTEAGTAVEGAGEGLADWTNNVQNELSTFDTQFESWKAEMQGKETEAEYKEKVANIEKMRADLTDKLQNAGDVAQENWGEFQTEVNNKVAELKNEMQEAKN